MFTHSAQTACGHSAQSPHRCWLPPSWLPAMACEECGGWMSGALRVCCAIGGSEEADKRFVAVPSNRVGTRDKKRPGAGIWCGRQADTSEPSNPRGVRARRRHHEPLSVALPEAASIACCDHCECEEGAMAPKRGRNPRQKVRMETCAPPPNTHGLDALLSVRGGDPVASSRPPRLGGPRRRAQALGWVAAHGWGGGARARCFQRRRHRRHHGNEGNG